MANLQLKSVSKLYPSGTLALYKADLQLSDSEFIAVVGGDKCGKSTLLRVIAGLEDATEGEVWVGGKDVTKLDAKDRDIAMIFQGNTLYIGLNVFENIAYGLRLRKASAALIEQRVKAAAALLGLSEVLFRKPKALTTEQKQKVAIARAIAREPKLYLLDDPLAGISPELRASLRSDLINLQMRLKGTFVYATKNVNEALTMATRLIVLRDGFVQQIDTPANLYDYPVNAYVAFTVGSPTVNFINDAVIEREGEALYAVKDGVRLPIPGNIVKRFTAVDEYAGSGKKVIIGIRPEDMGVDKQGFMQAKVATVQKISGAMYCELQGEKLSFVVKAKGLAKGDDVNACADLSHMLVFDAVTRYTLLERDEGYAKTDYADAQYKPLAYDDEEQIKSKLKLPDGKKKNKK